MRGDGWRRGVRLNEKKRNAPLNDVTLAQVPKVAAAIHLAMCKDPNVKMAMPWSADRWGGGWVKSATKAFGRWYDYETGEWDASSSAIEAYRLALEPYGLDGNLNGATWSGNLVEEFARSNMFGIVGHGEYIPQVNFEVGDILVKEDSNVAIWQGNEMFTSFFYDESEDGGRGALVYGWYDQWDFVLRFDLAKNIEKEKGKTMELKDTVEGMLSESYADRFVAEYQQTLIRYNKLDDMTVKYEAGTLDFKPDCPLDVLLEQKKHMGQYLRSLKVRAEIEGIEL